VQLYDYDAAVNERQATLHGFSCRPDRRHHTDLGECVLQQAVEVRRQEDSDEAALSETRQATVRGGGPPTRRVARRLDE
jgi:hypothetical protein